MKRENMIWIGAFAAFVSFCFFMRWEADRTRAKFTSDIREEISNAPANIINAVGDSVKKAASGLDSATRKPDSPPGEAVGGIINDVAGAVKNTMQPDGSSVTNPGFEDAAARVLDAAAQTAKKIDRVGLDATRLSDAEESDIGDEMAESVASGHRIIANSPEYPRIARLMAPILDDRRRRQIHYTFHLVDSKTVNAFSIAGGHVYVTTGFLREFPSDASLVMALAHEVGHVDLRHCVEKVQYARLGSKAVGDVAMMANIVYVTLSTPYTKDQEFDADQYGFLACRKAGWSAAELISLFTQLDAYEHREGLAIDASDSDSVLGTKLRNYFHSHPPTLERKQRLERLAH